VKIATRLKLSTIASLAVTACSSPSTNEIESANRNSARLDAPKVEVCGHSAGRDDNDGTCLVTTTQLDTNLFNYRIDQPVVNESSHAYPMVHVSPGDTITKISAGGCVQTGGRGSTWKRYVNPSGDDRDRFYFGRIAVPHQPQLMGGRAFRDLAATPNASYPIPELSESCEPAASLELRLEYTDDDWSDNGYWKHDDGNDNQCALDADGGSAWVEITIQRGTGAVAATPKPYDLVATCVDDNFFPLNPHWGWQETDLVSGGPAYSIGAIAALTSQSPVFEPPPNKWLTALTVPPVGTYIAGRICADDANIKHGHRNWMPATYTGIVSWYKHDPVAGGDDDYNMQLKPQTVGEGWAPGGLPDNKGYIKLEFDSDETIDRFAPDSASDEATGWWWRRFQIAVDNDDNRAKLMTDDRVAVAVGLMGVDEEHNGSELHPVYALAIQTDSIYPEGGCGTGDVHWSIFARNWGDEGECSSNEQYLLRREIRLRLPPVGISNPDLSKAPSLLSVKLRSPDGIDVSYEATGQISQANPGMVLSIHLPEPSSDEDQQGWTAGEVWVHWETVGSTNCGNFAGGIASSGSPLVAGASTTPDEEAEGLNPYIASLTLTAKQDFLDTFNALSPPKSRFSFSMVKATPGSAVSSLAPIPHTSSPMAIGPSPQRREWRWAAQTLAYYASRLGFDAAAASPVGVSMRQQHPSASTKVPGRSPSRLAP
jgi:hypothetical protein